MSDTFLPPPTVPPRGEETYLGDGLYVHFDGGQVWLRAPHPEGDHWIALEPEVWQRLRAWIDDYPDLKRHMQGNAP